MTRHARRWLLGLLVAPILAGLGPAWAGEQAPRFMVLVEERNLGSYPVAEAERVIIEHLLQKGLEVVDAELMKTNLDRDKALQAMTGGARAAAALGLQFGAEVIIVGRAIAKSSAETIKDTAFRSYLGNVSLRAIRTDTAEVLAVDNHEVAKIHVDDVAGGTLAIREATLPLVVRLVPKVLGRWGDGRQDAVHRIQLVVGNVQQLWQVAALRQLLAERVKGLKDIVQRSFVSGVAVFDARYSGEAQKLAEELTLAQPEHFRLRVLGVTPSKVDARLVDTGS